MDEIIRIYNLIGSMICHQLDERTISASGIMLPVCARDTGIYLGILTGIIFASVTRRWKSDSQPQILMVLVLCILMIPMMFDGIGSYLGFFKSSNTARLLTGAFFGMSLIMFLLPVANYKITGSNNTRLLKTPFELLIAISIIITICFAVLKGLIPYFPLATLIIGAMIFLLARITYTILFHAGNRLKKRIYLYTAGLLVLEITFLYLLSTYILHPLILYSLRKG